MSWKAGCTCVFLVFSSILVYIILIVVASSHTNGRYGKYALQDIVVRDLIITDLLPDLAGDHVAVLSCEIQLKIQANNSNNRLAIYYKRFQVAISYEGAEFGRASVTRFVQAPHNSTLVQTSFISQNVSLSVDQLRGLRSALVSEVVPLRFTVKLKGVAKFPYATWKNSFVKSQMGADIWCGANLKIPLLRSSTDNGSSHLTGRGCNWSLDPPTEDYY